MDGNGYLRQLAQVLPILLFSSVSFSPSGRQADTLTSSKCLLMKTTEKMVTVYKVLCFGTSP